MKSIAGEYLKGQKAIKFNAEIPNQWAELDKDQFSTIIQVLHFRKADPYTVSVSLLALLFGVKHFHILEGLPDEYLHSLVPLTNFLIEEKPAVKNHFPELKLKGKKCAAPDDDLSNIGFGEWCYAFEAYNYYKRSNDILGLNTLIATLYRPIDDTIKKDSASFPGDTREKFNEALLENHTKSVAAVDEKTKLAILAWFTVALLGVTALRPHVFPVRHDEEPAEASMPDQGSRTWLTVFRELLGPKWGKIDDLKYTNAMFVLDELEDRQIEYEKVKK